MDLFTAEFNSSTQKKYTEGEEKEGSNNLNSKCVLHICDWNV